MARQDEGNEEPRDEIERDNPMRERQGGDDMPRDSVDDRGVGAADEDDELDDDMDEEDDTEEEDVKS